MIRTRNFVIYMALLVFVLYGIGTTLLYQFMSDEPMDIVKVDFEEGGGVAGVVAHQKTDFRQENIERLKTKLAAGGGEISAGPPVFTSVDETPEPEEFTEERVLVRCGGYVDRSLGASAWPASGVEQSLVEGARLFKDSSGEILLQLPLTPIKQGGATCVSQNVIGVGVDGSLLTNDGVKVRNYAPLQLIGYALDGFPIYGPRLDDIPLDGCGGIDGATGYQYHVRNAEDFILACYSGIPVNL